MGLNCVRPVDPLGAVIPRVNGLDASLIRESGVPIIFLIGGPGAGKSSLNFYLRCYKALSNNQTNKIKFFSFVNSFIC